jgi:hypothetical protein
MRYKRKGCRSVNMVEYFALMYGNYSRNGGRRDKGE